jgi:hypothetical protein
LAEICLQLYVFLSRNIQSQRPRPGYAPIEAPPPPSELDAGRYLLRCLERLLPAVAAASASPAAAADGAALLGCDACLQSLGPLMGNRHVIEKALIPFLLGAGAAPPVSYTT